MMSKYRHHQMLLLLALIVSMFCISTVSAQQPQEENRPAGQGLMTSKPTAPGAEKIAPDRAINLFLRDAITSAIEHNLDVRLEKDDIAATTYELEGTRGFYDEVVGANFGFAHEENASDNLLYINNNPDKDKVYKLVTDTYDYGSYLQRRYANGGLLRIEFLNSRQESNERDFKLSTLYRSKAVVNFVQPLFKNFRQNENQRRARSLRKQLDLADEAFRQKLIDLIARTQAAYYDLIFAIKNEEIMRESVELAQAQLELNKLRVEQGSAAAVEIVASRSALEQRRDDDIAAQLAVTRAENALKNLIFDDVNREAWQHNIVPLEPVEFTNTPVDLESALKTAMTQRPELKQLDSYTELNKVELDFYKNQKKPQLDITGNFNTQYVMGGKNPLPQIQFLPLPKGIPPEFVGNYFEGLANIFKLRGYSVGADFTLIRGNHEAKGNISRLETVNEQIDIRKRQILQRIFSEVANAVQAVQAASQRVDAVRAAVVAATTQLKVEQKRFEVGRSTNLLVLEYQNRLSLARGRELRAKIDYIKARAELQRVMADNMP